MRRALGLCIWATLASCSFDTVLPDTPLEGRVFGKLDTQGHLPASGQSIVLSSDKGDRRTEMTGDDGSFSFGNVPVGLYLVSVSLPGYAKLSSDLVRVTSGGQIDLGTLAPQWLQNTPSEGSLSGRVAAAQGGDVTGAKVDFLLGGVVIDQLIVTADGLFTRRLPPGTLSVRASHPLFQNSMPVEVILGEGEVKDISAMPLVLDVNPATLTGSVFRERDGLEASPAAGATVTVVETGDTTVVDVAGNFRLTGLSAGTRQVRLSLSGYHDTAASRSVQLKPASTTDLAKVTLELDRGSIIGSVKLADGASVSGARVEVAGTRYAALVSANAQDSSRGDFVIDRIPLGNYSVTARQERYSNASASVNVTLDRPADIGVLTLARLFGDFLVEDSDPDSTAGYTHTLGVTLNFTSFPSTGVASYRASEDSSFDGGAFLPYTGRLQPFTLSAGEGVHTIYAQYTDVNGATSAAFTSTVVLDTTPPGPPMVTFDSSGSAGATRYINRSQDLRLTLDATDGTGSGLSKMRVGEVADGGAVLNASATYQSVATLTRASTAQGQQNVFVQVSDHAGNWSLLGTDSVVVDTVAPTGDITLQRGPKATDDGYTNTPLVTVNESWADPGGAPVVVKLANGQAELALATFQPTAAQQTWFLDPNGDGTKTVYAIFRDVAGNEIANFRSRTIEYDTRPPNPAAASVTTSLQTRNPTVGLSFNAEPNLSSTQALTLSDEATFTSATTIGPSAFPMSSSANFTLSAGDGLRTVYVRFRDRAGNDAVTSVSVQLDTVPPTGFLTVQGSLADGTVSEAMTSTASVVAKVSSNGGATHYAFAPNGSTVCTSGSLVFSPLVQDSIATTLVVSGNSGSVFLCLRDAVGNVSSLLSDSINFDATPPSGCTLALAGLRADGATAAPAGSTAKALVTATVGGCSVGTVEYYLSNGLVTCNAMTSASWVGFTSPSTSASFLLGGEGANTVSGCVRDAARNVAAISSAAMVLDTQPPSALGIVLHGGVDSFNASHLTSGIIRVSVQGQAVGATEWALSETTPTNFATFSGPTTFDFSSEGNKTLYAVFRDALWNQSAVVSDGVQVDITAPSTSGASLVLISPSGNSYLNSTSVLVRVTSPADADSLQLVEDLNAPNCDAADFASASRVAVASIFTQQLSPIQGGKRMCVRWFDSAGNASVALEDSKILDTVPPPQPSVLSSDRVFNPYAAGESLTQPVVFVNAPDPQHATWEILGGTVTDWTTIIPSVPAPGALAATFTVTTSPSATFGKPNVLKIRERDLAGNPGAEASITLTTDVVPPGPVTLNGYWTDNASQAGVVRWQRPGQNDIEQYLVYYGAASGNPGGLADGGSRTADAGYFNPDGGFIQPEGYNGFYAAQGASPVLVPNQDYAAFSGLPNGALTFVTVRAVDHAGNIGPAPSSSPREVALQPNLVSPNLLMEIPTVRDAGLTGGTSSSQVAVVGHYAYVRSTFSSCQNTIFAANLSELESPVQGGAIQPNAAIPTIYPVVVVNDGSCASGSGDMVVDYPYLFTAVGTHFRVWSIANPQTPTPMVDLDLTGSVPGLTALGTLEVRGNQAFVMGTGGGLGAFFHIDLSTLYDRNAATRPSVGGSVKFATNSGVATPIASGWTRDRVFFTNASAIGNTWDVTNAVDYNGLSNLAIGNRLTTVYPIISVNRHHYLTSGDLMVASENDGVHLYSLSLMLSGTNPFVTELSNIPWGVRGQAEQIGPQLFFNETSASGISTFDVSDRTVIVPTGTTRAAPAFNNEGLATYGPYAIQSSETGPSVRMYELAIPRGLRVLNSFAQPAYRFAPTPGFLISSSGLVLDAMTGGVPREVGSTNLTFGCVDDGVVFDDTLISTSEFTGQVRITPLDNAHARPGAPVLMSPLSTTVDLLPATSYARGVDRVGNYVVFTTARNTATTSVWIEVYRASGLRSTVQGNTRSFTPGATPGVGDKVAEFQFATTGLSASVIKPWLRVVNGMAVVSLTNTATVYIIDIRPMLDDSGVAMANSNIQGVISGIFVREATLAGTTLYATGTVGTMQGLHIYDAAAAFDGSGATVVSSGNLMKSLAIANASGLDVKGSYALVTGYNPTQGALTALDVSVPVSPKLIGFMPYPSGSASCAANRQSVQMAGSRAYVGSYERADVIELE